MEIFLISKITTRKYYLFAGFESASGSQKYSFLLLEKMILLITQNLNMQNI